MILKTCLMILIKVMRKTKKFLFLTQGIFGSSNNQTIIERFSNFLTGVIDGYTIVGINSKYNNKYGLKTVRAIKPGSVVYLQNENFNNEFITFFNQNDSFIGSNLILIK